MKLHNYLSLNLYSLVGCFDIAIFLYLFLAVELYTHKCNIKLWVISTDAICCTISILHIFALFLILCFLIEFALHKFNIKTIIINFDNIFYKILFYIGTITTSFGIVALITFYTLMTYSK